jgi:hypothetical protein
MTAEPVYFREPLFDLRLNAGYECFFLYRLCQKIRRNLYGLIK